MYLSCTYQIRSGIIDVVKKYDRLLQNNKRGVYNVVSSLSDVCKYSSLRTYKFVIYRDHSIFICREIKWPLKSSYIDQ